MGLSPFAKHPEDNALQRLARIRAALCGAPTTPPALTQMVNRLRPKGVSDGLPSLGFRIPWVFAGFPEGFLRVSEGFLKISGGSEGFLKVSHGFLMVSSRFVVGFRISHAEACLQ